MQGYILLSVLSEIGRANTKFFNLSLPPAALFMLSFLLVIITGSLLLMLPGATNGNGISFLNSLFTATSATCVTGLIVVPTGTFFTTFGKSVILVLIQLGGLGLMTFATFFALILRREFNMRHRVLLGDILDIDVFSKIKSMITGIILITIFAELSGAILIYINVRDFVDKPIFFSLFHSVSAFCNAGFSTIDSNLEPFFDNVNINFIVSTLIIFGGLGFVVMLDLLRFFSRLPSNLFLKRTRFSLQSKSVILMSILLITLGTCAILFLNYDNPFFGERFSQKLLSSYFHSVSTRTAGFNTIPINEMASGSIFFMMILMFIGASPGSTGGGIKTTTMLSLYALLRARLSGFSDIPLFNRSIPLEIVRDAGLIVVLALSLILMGTLVLVVTEPDMPFEYILFEEISAFATVGLSCGITDKLSDVGRIVIIITMFLGRIGPLTFLFAIAGKRKNKRIRNLDEKIMIG